MTEIMAIPNKVADIESESTPQESLGWLKGSRRFFKKVTYLYFQPKGWEKDGRLYESLGIKHFKFFVPTYGSLVAKYARKLGFEGLVSNRHEMASYEKMTRVNESIHLTVGSLTIPSIISSINSGHIESALAQTGLLLVLFNLYPIMLQRYNRSRIYRALELKNRLDARA